MTATTVALLLGLSVLLTADLDAAGNIIADNEAQCLVSLVVKQSLQLQQQATQLQQHSDLLDNLRDRVLSVEAADQERNVANRTKPNDAYYGHQHLSPVAPGLSDGLRSLQDRMNSLEARMKWNTENLTKLHEAQSEQNRTLQQHSDGLSSLGDKVKPMENSLKWHRQNLTALNETQSQQDKILQRQAKELRSLRDEVHSVDTDLDWVTGNLTMLNNASVKQAAFSVRYSGYNTINVGSRGILKFPDIVTNVGNGYSQATGRFTAPYAGAYAFYGSLRSSNNHQWISLGIYKGNTFLVEFTGKGRDDPWDRGSGFVTTRLDKGDYVYVRHHVGGTFLDSAGFTTFSGMLVTAD